MHRLAFLALLALLQFAVSEDKLLLTFGSVVALHNRSFKVYLGTSDVVIWQQKLGQLVIGYPNDISHWVVLPHDDAKFGMPVPCNSKVVLAESEEFLKLHFSHDLLGVISKAPQLYASKKSSAELAVFTLKCNGAFVKDGDAIDLSIEGEGYLTSSNKYRATGANCPRCPFLGGYDLIVQPKPTNKQWQVKIHSQPSLEHPELTSDNSAKTRDEL